MSHRIKQLRYVLGAIGLASSSLVLADAPLTCQLDNPPTTAQVNTTVTANLSCENKTTNQNIYQHLLIIK